MSKAAPNNSALTAKERALVFHQIERTLSIETPNDFLNWARDELKTIFPYEILICGTGQINARNIHIKKYLCDGFPMEYVEAIRHSDQGVISPVMAKWCKERKPQLFEPDVCECGDAEWLKKFHEYDLKNIAAHGMHDMQSSVASYFNFSRIPTRLGKWHEYMLNLLIPHMHVSLVRVLEKVKPAHDSAFVGSAFLSDREQEILRWLREGKTNWEIAHILNISEKTVKNHVHHILVKLRVNNRAQAVAKAIDINAIV